MGHADEQITQKHYGKMSERRSNELIDALSSDEVFTDEENAIIIDYHEGRFQRGTAEYAFARMLAEKRESRAGIVLYCPSGKVLLRLLPFHTNQ